MFRSPDNKLMPFSYATGDDYGFELIYGIPGRGKSVLMNCLTFAHLFQGTSLPLAVTIDIGPSSARPYLAHPGGAAGAVPQGRGRVVSPADGQGIRDQPLRHRRLAAVPPSRPGASFWRTCSGLILTPAGAEGVPDGLRETIGPAVEAMYEMRSDRKAGAEPHGYTAGRDPVVDEALRVYGCRLPSSPLWWDVVDALFEGGRLRGRVPRPALSPSPLLSDLPFGPSASRGFRA